MYIPLICFYNEPAAKAQKKVTQLTGMNRVFFTNSGTEAIEGAIKLVRKYAYNKDGRTDHEIYCHEAFIPWKKYGSSFSNRK